MTMHVVQDPTNPPEQQAQAGQQPEGNKNAGIFWFLVGGVAGAVAMHITARKMQEYAGGMYLSRARLQSRLGRPTSMHEAMTEEAAEEEIAEGRWW